MGPLIFMLSSQFQNMLLQQKEEPSRQEEKLSEISGLEWGGRKVENAQQVCVMIFFTYSKTFKYDHPC